MKSMATLQRKDKEATAVACVADAAREVQAASTALEERFKESTHGAAPTLQLARLTAVMNELQAARDALDFLLAERSAVEEPRKRDA
jgi:siderophore synthetase component